MHRDDARRVREGAQLASQARDVDVERVVVDDRAVGPRRGDQGAAARRLARPRGQRGEEAELGGSERDALTVADGGMGGGVQAQGADVDPGLGRRPRSRACSRATSTSKSKGLVT